MEQTASVPSICIPHVFPNITEKRIRRIINDLNMGEIRNIEMIPKVNKKGEKYNQLVIHFHKWTVTDPQDPNNVLLQLLQGKEIKIVYDTPWFWRVSLFRRSQREERDKTQREERQRQRPFFVFEEEPRYQDPRPRYQDPRPRYQERRQDPTPKRQDPKKVQEFKPIPPPIPPLKKPEDIAPPTKPVAKPNNYPDIDKPSEPVPVAIDYGEYHIPIKRKKNLAKPV
jgi:hypothetical protein